MVTATLNPLLDWVFKPKHEHVVQFYPYDSALILPLLEYISTGLRAGDTCIVIASQKHLISLNEQLAESGIDVVAATASGQYMIFDADQTLAKIMANGTPNQKRFVELADSMMGAAMSNGKPVRIYGEMVALLWKEGNKEAVIRLEKYWNELGKEYDFSLYCGYPELHFIMHQNELDEIQALHAPDYPAVNA